MRRNSSRPYLTQLARNRSFAAGALLSIVALVFALQRWDVLDDLWHWVDIVMGLFTALMASAIWFLDSDQHLPRRLTVEFWFEGQEVYTESQAVLFHEADARPLAQQIGSQIKMFVTQDPRQSRLEFNATEIEEVHRGREYGSYGAVYTLHIRIILTQKEDAKIFQQYKTLTGAAGAGSRPLG